MTAETNWTARAVFIFFFALVLLTGLAAANWRRPKSFNIGEWGLGGRQFGTWITWFLIGGDLYTAYTMIAVPALVFATGAYGFFALPYAIIVYPFVFTVMPRLWKEAKDNDYLTAADLVLGRYGCRPLELAMALTGVLATLPYIALQLTGLETVLRALGLEGRIPLFAAFLILCLYDYSSGLRAPALTAFIKDTMVYIVVIAAVALIPLKLGGYGAVFEAAAGAFAARGSGGVLLSPDQYVAYATLALGSAAALFMYPHALTGILASSSEETIRKNAMLLPAYTFLLGLVALLGLMGHAAGLKLANNNDVVPILFETLFPSWFSGFAFAAIGIGALVPAAVMSIGAANLFTRNFWKAYINPKVSLAAEARVAKFSSLSVKAGALMVSLFLPAQFTLDLQLLGGVWILQTFPALVFGLYTGWFRAGALIAGWAAGFATGSWLVFANNFKPLQTVYLGAASVTAYSGLLALAINILAAALISAILRRLAMSQLARKR